MALSTVATHARPHGVWPFSSAYKPCLESCQRRAVLRLITSPKSLSYGQTSFQPLRSSKRDTASVVEYLLLLQGRPEASLEDMEVLIDSLWSLQYMVPSIMYAAAGPVKDCSSDAFIFQQHRQQMQQQAEQAQPVAASRQSSIGVPASSSSSSSQLEPQQPESFSHAVHFRLSDTNALQKLLAHRLMASMQQQVQSQCSCSAHVVYEGTVPKDLMAIFRRGDEFASGVDHILLLQPNANSSTGACQFLQKLAALAESAIAGGIQTTYGPIISSSNSTATHVLMTRFAAPQQVEQLLQTPACAAVLQRDTRVPLVAAKSLCTSIQPIGETNKVDRVMFGR